MRPGEVDASNIRKFIEQKLLEGLSPGTVGLCIRLLSTFFSDIVEQRFVGVNPVSTLPRSTRRLYRVALDPRGVPFLERSEDIRRVFLNMPEPCRVAFAVGALAGLRTGEILGLEWQDVDLEARRLHVRQQVQDGRLGPVKDDDARVVPILKSLSPILSEWRLATGGAGLLFKPPHPTRGGRPGRPAAFIRQHTLRRHLLDALRTCELEEMTWYQATRHSFASHWVLSGGSIEKLSAVLGHSSVTTTQRYAHLRPDLFMESDFDRVQVDLARPRGDVVSVCPQPEDGAVSYAAATRASGPAH
ncbi:MAG: site-specific integrase [Proteobacteria bacterium]|nr:site-specific integrase [Pseudomonadota bacterium]